MAIKIHPSIHAHPGPWLKRQIVEPRGINVKAARRASGRFPPEPEQCFERPHRAVGRNGDPFRESLRIAGGNAPADAGSL